jgi:hypothetical protein
MTSAKFLAETHFDARGRALDVRDVGEHVQLFTR